MKSISIFNLVSNFIENKNIPFPFDLAQKANCKSLKVKNMKPF